MLLASFLVYSFGCLLINPSLQKLHLRANLVHNITVKANQSKFKYCD